MFLDYYFAGQNPIEWGKDRLLRPGVFAKQYSTSGLIEIEGRVYKWLVLIPLTAFFGPWLALLITLPYGFLVTGVYEWLRRRRGLPDLMEASDDLVKIYPLGFQQFAFARGVKGPLNPKRPHWVKLPIIFLGAAICGGVYAVHHYLRMAGYGGWVAVIGNMIGRVAALPYRWLEITLTFTLFSLTFSGIKMVVIKLIEQFV